jgi:predicted nucleotidyltransferase
VNKSSGIDEGVVREIVARVLSASDPDRILLFGSASSRTMSENSDIDLLIVERSLTDPHSESVRIRHAIGDIGYAVDVIVMDRHRFEETKHVIGGIAWPANQYGRVLYEAA